MFCVAGFRSTRTSFTCVNMVNSFITLCFGISVLDQPEPESQSYFEQQKAKSPRSPTNLVKSTPAIWKPSGPSLVKKEYKPVRLDTSPKPEKRFNQKVSLHLNFNKRSFSDVFHSQLCLTWNSHEKSFMQISCEASWEIYINIMWDKTACIMFYHRGDSLQLSVFPSVDQCLLTV